MATYTKHILSGSINGRGIPVVAQATTTGITTLHTAATGTTGIDEIWLYVQNTATAERFLQITFGGTTTDDRIQDTVPAQPNGLFMVVAGLPINNGLIVGAQATATTGELKAFGYVHRIAT
jgi:hypothetical protein